MRCINATLVPWEENSQGTMQPMFSNPVKAGSVTEWSEVHKLVACGHCFYCLKKRARDWAFRLFYESYNYVRPPVAITLTYNQANITMNNTTCQVMQLFYRDVQLYFKRLRKKFKDCKIKYFVASEYGSTRKRPHYHLIVFGLPQEAYENWQVCHKKGQRTENGSRAKTTQYYCPMLHRIWDKGISVYSVCESRAAILYVTGYAVKKRKTTKLTFPNYKIVSNRRYKVWKELLAEAGEESAYLMFSSARLKELTRTFPISIINRMAMDEFNGYTHIRKGDKLISLKDGTVDYVFESNHQSKGLGANLLNNLQELYDAYDNGKYIDGKLYYPPRYYRKKLEQGYISEREYNTLFRFNTMRFEDNATRIREEAEKLNISYQEYLSNLKHDANREFQKQYMMRSLE